MVFPVVCETAPEVGYRLVYFQRRGCALAPNQRVADYLPGDVVTWDLGSNVPISDWSWVRLRVTRGRPLIVHNIGAGTHLEDVLFTWRVLGHSRYFP